MLFISVPNPVRRMTGPRVGGIHSGGDLIAAHAGHGRSTSSTSNESWWNREAILPIGRDFHGMPLAPQQSATMLRTISSSSPITPATGGRRGELEFLDDPALGRGRQTDGERCALPGVDCKSMLPW